MKVWTFKEMYNKILRDLDLEDETFISLDEMIGYFNESLNEAESEIMSTNQDYFLAKFFVPTELGQQEYALPYNIYANKIRGFIYHNNAIIYRIDQVRRKDKFEKIANLEQYGLYDDYMYILSNDVIGKSKMILYPGAREATILSPVNARFAPFILWYIRNCARVPLIGEFCNPEVIAASQVTDPLIQTYAGTKTIGNPAQGIPGAYPGSIPYKTGDAVRLELGPNSTLPSNLEEDVTYYVIASFTGQINLATSKVNAINGVAMGLGTGQTGYFYLRPAATQEIIMATLIDIPEFATFVMQWVKCRCMEKEGDPRLQAASQILMQQKKQMIDTLTKAIEDDDDTIQADFSFYNDYT